MQRTDISQCVTVILTNLIKAGKDYQCSVTIFVTVSFNCYCLPARFVNHVNIREFRGKTQVYYIFNILQTIQLDLHPVNNNEIYIVSNMPCLVNYNNLILISVECLIRAKFNHFLVSGISLSFQD